MRNSNQLWLVLVCCASMLIGIALVGCTPKLAVKHIESPVSLEVTAGTPVSELRLPAKVMVELSNGQREQREITWDMSQLPLTLEQEVIVPGKIAGGESTVIAIKVRKAPVDAKPELPSISAEVAASCMAASAMEDSLKQNAWTSLVTWSRAKQAVAFVFNDELLFLWKAGNTEPEQIDGIHALFASAMAWSYDDRFFWLNSGTSSLRGCDVIDATKGQLVASLGIAGCGVWAPERNLLLVGLPNREVELYFREPEYGIDLAVFDAETRVMQMLASSTGEYEYAPLSWDILGRAIYRQRFFGDRRGFESIRVIDNLVYHVGEVTLNPAIPVLTEAELSSPHLAAILNEKLQIAGLRAITWRQDQSAVAFLTASDCYVWQLPEAEPKQINSVRRGGFNQLHHLAWSPDDRYLSIHEGIGQETNLKVLSFPEPEIVVDSPVYVLAYWAPDTNQLLLATPSGIAPTIDFVPSYTADLALLDVVTGQKRVLLRADGKTSYRPMGWITPSTISYDHMEGRRYSPSQELKIVP